MIELVKVVRLRPEGDFRLWLEFSNGQSGVCDFADMIAEGGTMVAPLSDLNF